jgi:uncharacterized membrane protein
MPFLRMNYFPLAWPLLLALFGLVAILVMLVELNVLKYVYARMGIPPRYILAILLLTLLGSSINVPIAQLPPVRVVTGKMAHSSGIRHVAPQVREWPGMVLAINVGGALIPIILSVYLTLKNRLLVQGLIAVAAVALVVHELARPVRGVGIAVPLLIPPIVAVLVALVLSWRRAAPLAYIAGSIGTLIGADLLNLGKLRALGVTDASIGGAGTFDGVFLVGIVAVLLASLFQTSSAPDERQRHRLQ